MLEFQEPVWPLAGYSPIHSHFMLSSFFLPSTANLWPNPVTYFLPVHFTSSLHQIPIILILLSSFSQIFLNSNLAFMYIAETSRLHFHTHFPCYVWHRHTLATRNGIWRVHKNRMFSSFVQQRTVGVQLACLIAPAKHMKAHWSNRDRPLAQVNLNNITSYFLAFAFHHLAHLPEWWGKRVRKKCFKRSLCMTNSPL